MELLHMVHTYYILVHICMAAYEFTCLTIVPGCGWLVQGHLFCQFRQRVVDGPSAAERHGKSPLDYLHPVHLLDRYTGAHRLRRRKRTQQPNIVIIIIGTTCIPIITVIDIVLITTINGSTLPRLIFIVQSNYRSAASAHFLQFFGRPTIVFARTACSHCYVSQVQTLQNKRK